MDGADALEKPDVVVASLHSTKSGLKSSLHTGLLKKSSMSHSETWRNSFEVLHPEVSSPKFSLFRLLFSFGFSTQVVGGGQQT